MTICSNSARLKLLFNNTGYNRADNIQQQQPSLIPLSGVGYMDQITP